jgi:Ca2+-binding RTX toxin-like protein
VIRNTGTIEGDINLGGGDDIILNAKGTIEGNVNLGDGEDQYVGGSGDFINGVAGGAGSDVYTFLGHMTHVIEEVGGGTADIVQTDVNGSLAANVENLSLIGDDNTTGHGNVLANQIVGNSGDNRLFGAGGADVLVGGGGSDVLNGGGGSDTADYEDSDEAVVVNLGANTATGGSADGDMFVSIENLNGSAFGDNLVGSNDGNTINGLAGTDTLDGGKGNDFLTGGDGKDVFVFTKGGNHDTIEDFHSHHIDATVADTINLHEFHAKIASFAALKGFMTDHGTDVDITIGTDVLTVIVMHKVDFDKTDFIL